jgi:hypothetical protein
MPANLPVILFLTDSKTIDLGFEILFGRKIQIRHVCVPAEIIKPVYTVFTFGPIKLNTSQSTCVHQFVLLLQMFILSLMGFGIISFYG